jgi:hypothetical protein
VASRTILGQEELICGPLECLELSDCRGVTDAGVYDLGRVALGLLDLSLYGCSQLSDTALLGLGSRQHRLQRLNTAGAYKITRSGTHMLFSTAPDLELYNDPGAFWKRQNGGLVGLGGPAAPSTELALRQLPPWPRVAMALQELCMPARTTGSPTPPSPRARQGAQQEFSDSKMDNDLSGV